MFTKAFFVVVFGTVIVAMITRHTFKEVIQPGKPLFGLAEFLAKSSITTSETISDG
ncbi:hypothetical protein [uncultured Cedecea sp.]|uniref:hypothetical protein n=1 Tax=uncultured Cedecea sp. TaxID=988762 RepID=UPI00261698DC|nr:hypothetical protein [uncultured Cedecea sp.]